MEINSATLARLFNQGELEMSINTPFLVDRVALNIQLGVSEYVLPDNILSIRRITYRGIGIDPLKPIEFRDIFENGAQQGTPFWYIYRDAGINTIQLFPQPAENLGVPSGSLWQSDTNISGSCIVEYYRAADNSNFTLPDYLRNQILKRYVAMKVAAIEGPQQSLKAQKYFTGEWAKWATLFKMFYMEMYTLPRRWVVSDIVYSNYYPGTPVLPIARFGQGVDPGE